MTRWDAFADVCGFLRAGLLGGEPPLLRPNRNWELLIEMSSFHFVTPSLAPGGRRPGPSRLQALEGGAHQRCTADPRSAPELGRSEEEREVTRFERPAIGVGGLESPPERASRFAVPVHAGGRAQKGRKRAKQRQQGKDSMHVGVLGGGLQGCCAALALADRAVRVTLFDKNDALLSRAAVANEGKIHLGYMYTGDPTLSAPGSSPNQIVIVGG